MIAPSEDCEDGNTASGDGCDANCKFEAGWTPTQMPYSTDKNRTVFTAICGDGIVVSAEACDDGTPSDGLGCASTCGGPIAGWFCSSPTPGATSVCNEVCGNGIKSISEECDDGNTNGGDGCDSLCKLEPCFGVQVGAPD